MLARPLPYIPVVIEDNGAAKGRDRVAETRVAYQAFQSNPDLLREFEDSDLLRLRAALDSEMKKRKLPGSVGPWAEKLAIDFFRCTPGRPTLIPAAPGTKNVDALSQNGERYSIKCICAGSKTGTVYPDRTDPERQLFEYILVVKLDADWALEAIYEFDWETFCEVRSWDIRMSAWYIGGSARKLARATKFVPA